MASARRLPLIPWDESRILEERNSREVIRIVLDTTLDIMIFGYPSQANRLVDSLYEHGNGIQFDLQEHYWPLHCAWKATGSTPKYILDPDPDKISNVPDASGEGKNGLKALAEGVYRNWPEDIKAKVPNLAPSDLELALGHLNSQPENPYSKDNAPIAVAVEVALAVGDTNKARELIETSLLDMYKKTQESSREENADVDALRRWLNNRVCIARATRIWEILKEAIVASALNIDENDLGAFVDQGCKLIQERFTNGPHRPLASKTIAELVQIMDENYVAARKAEPEGKPMTVDMIDSEPPPESFLTSPATDGDLEELQNKLAHSDGESGAGIELPNDYKDFLRVTNGFYPGDDPSDQSSIFYGIAEITRDEFEETFLSELEFTLFPIEYTATEEIDYIQFPQNIQTFSIGAGGDEGHIWLVEPDSVRQILSDFELAYEKASERTKRIYERAAFDLYGGLGRLRELEWLVVSAYHWDPDGKIFGGFRDYLELEAIPYAIRERKRDESRKYEKKRKSHVDQDEIQEDGKENKANESGGKVSNLEKDVSDAQASEDQEGRTKVRRTE